DPPEPASHQRLEESIARGPAPGLLLRPPARRPYGGLRTQLRAPRRQAEGRRFRQVARVHHRALLRLHGVDRKDGRRHRRRYRHHVALMDTLDPIGPDQPAPESIVWRRRPSREGIETSGFIERARKSAASGAADEALGWYERARVALATHGPSADLADVIRWKGSVHAE